jgi:hypothetical protein
VSVGLPAALGKRASRLVVGMLMTPHIIRILENHLREIAKVRRNPKLAERGSPVMSYC